MYFVNFSLDIAIGTFMIWCFVRVQELTAVRCGIDSLKVSHTTCVTATNAIATAMLIRLQ